MNYPQPKDLTIDYAKELRNYNSISRDNAYIPERRKTKELGSEGLMKIIKESNEWFREKEIQEQLDAQREHAATYKNPARSALSTESILF